MKPMDPDIKAIFDEMLPLLDEFSVGDEGYGDFKGGDPREFIPSDDATEEEKARHAADCKSWDEGNQKEPEWGPLEHGIAEPKDGKLQVVLGHYTCYGPGTYKLADTCGALAQRIRARLVESGYCSICDGKGTVVEAIDDNGEHRTTCSRCKGSGKEPT